MCLAEAWRGRERDGLHDDEQTKEAFQTDYFILTHLQCAIDACNSCDKMQRRQWRDV